jgi:hypothetical protein
MRPRRANVALGDNHRQRQAMIESCIVIVFLCLLFIGLFQLAHAFVAREVLCHAAARAARARSVGFNRWMVEKTARVAAIPNAGVLIEPAVAGGDQTLATLLATAQPGQLWDLALRAAPASPTAAIELARIPAYLAAYNRARAQALLDYQDWDTIIPPSPLIDQSAGIDPDAAARITATVAQPHPLLLALGDLAAGVLAPTNGDERVYLSGTYSIEDHFSLYIDDQNWAHARVFP